MKGSYITQVLKYLEEIALCVNFRAVRDSVRASVTHRSCFPQKFMYLVLGDANKTGAQIWSPSPSGEITQRKGWLFQDQVSTGSPKRSLFVIKRQLKNHRFFGYLHYWRAEEINWKITIRLMLQKIYVSEKVFPIFFSFLSGRSTRYHLAFKRKRFRAR